MQPEWEALQAEVRDLAARVAHLEQATGLARAAEPQAQPPAQPKARTPLPLAALGRALLGLAGAYLLRALTEAGTLPHQAGIAAGFLYAIAWMIAAAKAPPERRVDTALHSLTSVLVLSPLLWEATLRFHAITTWTAGGILLFFTVFGLAVSWRKNILIPATIATLAGVGTSAALLIATYDVLPFTFVLLAIAAAVEASACLDHWLSERWLAASAADLSVLLATWLVTREYGLPPDYAPIPHAWLVAALVSLLAIYLSSTIVRTLLRGFTFTWFETGQCAVALAITVGGCLRLSAEDPRVAPLIGWMALAAAAACYVVSFARLDRGGAPSRNLYTYSTFGILLALAGARILLSGDAAAIAWSALALACLGAGSFYTRFTLLVHGAIYLLLALLGSGILVEAARSLLGTSTQPAHVPMTCLGLLVCAAGLAACRDTRPQVSILRLSLAAGLVWLAAGLAAAALTGTYHALFGAGATHAYCATLRTSVLALGALLAAWVGTRWQNPAFARLIYPLMLLGAYRLVTDDMHLDQKAASVLSLLVYGAALMLLPKLVRST
ncbi:conserved membrane hypothetical protein [Candidatus Sulfopaludibacter sp. SbA3]|nr:conserved membrane hypothetical protein [Candidatus Sulfopaludibacter sp. SbA3]